MLHVVLAESLLKIKEAADHVNEIHGGCVGLIDTLRVLFVNTEKRLKLILLLERMSHVEFHLIKVSFEQRFY